MKDVMLVLIKIMYCNMHTKSILKMLADLKNSVRRPVLDHAGFIMFRVFGVHKK